MSNNTQPDWSNAPADAEYAGWASAPRKWCWYKDISEDRYMYCYSSDSFWMHNTTPKPLHEPLIPRPQPEQWENGVPPVGWYGEVTWGTKTDWRECVILPSNQIAWLGFGVGAWRTNEIWDNAEFREGRSPRDRAIDAALDIGQKTLDLKDPMTDDARRIFGALYDAGMLKEVE